MDQKKAKELLRKHKKPRSPSSSDSSSSSESDTGSTSDSFTSSSSSKKPLKRKTRRIRPSNRSSSSSDETRIRKKHACHKKLDSKHLKRKLKEAKAKKRMLSPSMRKQSITPKKLAMSVAEKKHHALIAKERLRDKDREREREREKEKLRLRERERIRSRSPMKKMKSRSPKLLRGRELKRKSPVDKHHSPREKLICQIRRDRSPSDRKKEMRKLHDSRERERRVREREEREAARNKEREEALARCQERQRERERLAREKVRREKDDRLLPRPAEREMAIAASRAVSRERSFERDPHISHSHSRVTRDAVYERGYEREYVQHDHRIEKDDRREHEREYLLLHRREINSPTLGVPHYSERSRDAERELYPEEQKYEREHAYLQRNYVSPSADSHRRETNWERDSEIIRERDVEHGKIYTGERSLVASRDWPSAKENWRASQNDQWEENWPRNEAPEGEWTSDKNFHSHQQHEWEDLRTKHDAHRDEHTNAQTPSSRRWPQQDWRGRQNEDRTLHQGQLQPTFLHSTPPPHQIEYSHERPEPVYRRQHPPKPLMQQHVPHPGTYHVRPHFPSKRQMTYINPNMTLLKTSATANQMHTVLGAPQKQVTNQPSTASSLSTVVEKAQQILDKIEDKIKDKQGSENKDLSFLKSKELVNITGKQLDKEPIRDDLSEISDDVDEILNKEEINRNVDEENWDSDSNCVPENELKKSEETFVATSNEDDKKQEIIASELQENEEQSLLTSVATVDENEKLTEQREENKDIDILDFEEISDGELEEDARTKNLSDALGVDWASLIEESKFRQISAEKQTTAKQKWQPHRVILDVGISLKYAGSEFAKKLYKDVSLKLSEEEQENNIEITKNEEIVSNDSIVLKMEISDNKTSIVKNENLEDEKLELNELACVQVVKNKQNRDKKILIFNACGPNNRALSARRDLRLRRQLCGLPVKEVGEQRPVSNNLKELALKVFQKVVI